MSQKKKTKTPPVTLVTDPFKLNHLEVSQVQDSQDEIDEGFNAEDSEEAETFAGLPPEFVAEEEDPAVLENLAQAVSNQVAQDEAVQRALLAGEPALDAAAELKAQIEEDEALEAELAREREEQGDAIETHPELLAALPQVGADGELDLAEVQSCIEALVLISDKPLSLKKLHELVGEGFKFGVFQEALTELKKKYQEPHHGIEIAEVAGGIQYRTKPGRAALAKKLAKIQPHRLSSGAMETLALIAYKQPIMKEEIDDIRGVDSSYFLRGLLEKHLIQIGGRSDLPGRPMLYETTTEFMQVFGIKDLASLPPLQEIETMIPATQAGDEDPRVKQMRKLVDQMNSDTSVSLLYDPQEDERILTEIKDKVSSIETSTPYIEEQRALEKAAKLAVEMVQDSSQTEKTE